MYMRLTVLEIDATLVFEQNSYQISEADGSLSIGVMITDIPAGGVECDITVHLISSDGAKAGKVLKCKYDGELFNVHVPFQCRIWVRL